MVTGLDAKPTITSSEPEPPVMDYNCEQVYTSFKMCVEYLIGGNGPSIDCCKSVSKVKSSAPTINERRAACKCFEEVAIRLPALNQDRFASLPNSCGVNMGFPLSKTTDCNKGRVVGEFEGRKNLANPWRDDEETWKCGNVEKFLFSKGGKEEGVLERMRTRGSEGQGFMSGAGETELQRRRLFATVDPRVRSAVLPSEKMVLFSDTVGFISDLPVQLVEAFHATLEEVVEADLLVHVVDSSAPNLDEHSSTMFQVLQQTGVSEEKLQSMIEVWNKIDMEEEYMDVDEHLDDEDEGENEDADENNIFNGQWR
ncbi:hypothetical protein VNO78_31875 [Psophocarpus tetragonolobus]|uniref:Non-specific lipid-transfer protein n=1 Tax=Psophocarpus tetragonolobus TaxID=3891 RepID=A0AAN9RZ76_PSOTE